MKTVSFLRAACMAGVAAAAWSAPAAAFYQLSDTLTIESPSVPSWDYLTYDPSHDYLYIARRQDGILIYDAKARKIIGALEDSKDGNSTTLIPEFDLGYVTHLDGSATLFKISTLKPIKRVKFGEAADNAFYEPVTRQLIVTMGDTRQVAFLDAKTGSLVGKLDMESEHLEGTAPDGQGNVFMALRDRNKVLRIDVRERKITADWTPEGCELPNSVAFDTMNNRLFVTCRGDRPILAVIDPSSGKVIAAPAIGRGNDVIVFDPQTRKIYTSNGFDGTLVIIHQIDADHYELSEAPTTRPYARTMALDPKTKTVYTVTAEGTVDPSKPVKTEVAPFYPNTYFVNTFTLLTYTEH